MPAGELKKQKEEIIKNQPEDQPLPVTVKPEPIKVLLAWKAPSRLFIKRTREYFTTLWSIVLLLVIILAFLQEWGLIMVVIALTFLNYLYSTVKPAEVEYKITNKGVDIAGLKFSWTTLRRFWFKEKWGQTICFIDTLFRLPGRLTIILGDNNKEAVEKILSQYLLQEEPEKTWVDRASERLSSLVRLERTS